MEHGKQQVMLSRSYWILFLFMILFDPPVWQCQQQLDLPLDTEDDERLCGYHVVEAHLLRVFKPHISSPHNLRDRTLPIAIHYMFHMDDHSSRC